MSHELHIYTVTNDSLCYATHHPYPFTNAPPPLPSLTELARAPNMCAVASVCIKLNTFVYYLMLFHFSASYNLPINFNVKIRMRCVLLLFL